MTSGAEMAAVAKQAEDYITSSAKTAFERVCIIYHALSMPDFYANL
jgi:spore coat polysaccharide biosynthesis predicted glycosyltransferase SpsG